MDAQTADWLNELCIETNSGSNSFCSRGKLGGCLFCKALIDTVAGRRGLVRRNESSQVDSSTSAIETGMNPASVF